jgi:glutathione reductase (NADPH)
MHYDFDLFVIGAGSGGVRAARIAAQNGARVAIAEESRIGGTCVVRGCVPKKILVLASRFHDAFDDAEGYGWSFPQKPDFSWEKLRDVKEREVTRLSGLYEDNLIKAGVVIFHERAVVEGNNAVRLSQQETRLTARHILVAVGGRPRMPDIVGCELGLTSDDMFDLPQQPQTLLVVGGGYIALEFACLFQRLGTRVSVVHRRAHVLPDFDADIRNELMAAMRHDGVELRLGTNITQVTQQGSSRHVIFDQGPPAAYDAVLFATGRVPNTDGLGLEKAGLDLDSSGVVRVDTSSRTASDAVYAVGDVTDRVNLTPVAIREGHAFADSLYGKKPWNVAHDPVATAVFTTPEIGVVGLTEEAALRKSLSVDIYKTRFRSLKHTLTRRQERTLMKLVVDTATDVVLGVHILGEDAGELIQLAAVIVQNKLTKAALDATIAVHPTAAEELVTMRNAERKTVSD